MFKVVAAPCSQLSDERDECTLIVGPFGDANDISVDCLPRKNPWLMTSPMPKDTLYLPMAMVSNIPVSLIMRNGE